VRAKILTLDEGESVASLRTDGEDNQGDGDGDGDEEIRTRNLLVPNIELATGCSPAHLPGGPPSALAQSLSQRVLSLLHVSRIIRAEDLRIWHIPTSTNGTGSLSSSSSSSSESNSQTSSDDDDDMSDVPSTIRKPKELKAYWTLYLDLVLLSLSGNAFDSIFLAAYAALASTILPSAYYDGDREMILCDDDVSKARKLNLRGTPVPLTWTAFNADVRGDVARNGNTSKAGPAEKGARDGNWILVDADGFEEGLCDEGGCVVVDYDSSIATKGRPRGLKIVKLEKNGGGVVGAKELRMLMEVAERRRSEWIDVLARAAKDEEKR
jgi:exosome complex component RRP43